MDTHEKDPERSERPPIALVPLVSITPDKEMPKIKLLWTAELDTLIESAATVSDVDNDGVDEAVIVGQTSITVLDGTGRTKWQWEAERRFCTYPTVMGRGDQPALIFAADLGGNLYCLDGEGKEVWRASLGAGTSWSATVVCDLDGDGREEAIQTDAKGTVWAFDASTGDVKWKGSVQGAPVSPAVGDLDGEGRLEVVVATGAGMLSALGSDGSPLWSREIGGPSQSWQTGAPVLFTSASGSQRIAVGTPGGEIICLDAGGEVLWRRRVEGPVPSSISVADFDGDGLSDIFLITERGVIYRFREDGTRLWALDMKGRTLAPGAMVDVDADGQLEYLVCTQNGRLLVLGQRGELLLDRQFEHRTINSTPAFGNMLRDSPGLEMVITGGESGRVLCFSTDAPVDATGPWPSYRRDPAMMGEASREEVKPPGAMVPENLGPGEILCGQGVSFAVQHDVSGKPLKATATCIRPDGSTQAVMTGICEDHARVVLPLEATRPGIYRFAWCLTDAAGSSIALGSRDIFIQPFANDRAAAAQASGRLRSVADMVDRILPLSASALTREARLLEDSARALLPAQDAALSPRADAGEVSDVLDRTAALSASSLRAMRISDVVKVAVSLGPGTSLVVSEPENPWENLGLSDEVPHGAAAPLAIRRRAVPGEHDPVALNLFNIADRTVRARIRVEVPDGGPTAIIHKVVGVPTPMGEMAWDALPELDESFTVTVPSLSTVQIWLDLDLSEVEPGEHKVKVCIQALDGAGVLEGSRARRAAPAPETEIDISLEVLPFEMAPPGAFRLCTWGYVESSQYGGYADATYGNLLAHGNNVFPISALPAGTYDDVGNLETTPDYARLDSVLEHLRGYDAFVLLQGYPGLAPADGAGEFGSPAYRKALKAYLEDLVAHMESFGFDREHYALYPIDEPGGHGWPAVRRLVEFGKMVRDADPKVKVYVNGGGDVAMYEVLAPVTDIWCPGLNQIAEEPEKTEVMAAPGKQIWSYNCSYSNCTCAGRTLKGADLVAEYRAAAIFAFRYDINGAGFWTSIMGNEDPWTRTEGYDYMILYPGRTRPVTSRRWEAVREGVEDFRILIALRECLRDPGIGEDVRARIRHLFEVSVPRFVGKVMNFRDIPQNLAESLRSLRSEMMDCVSAVSDD